MFAKGTSATLVLATDSFFSSGGIADYTRHLVRALVLSAPINHSRIILVTYCLPNLSYDLPDSPRLTVYKVTSRVQYLYVLARLFIGFRVTHVFCCHKNLYLPASIFSLFHRSRCFLFIYGIEVWRQSSLLFAFFTKHVTTVSIGKYTLQRAIDSGLSTPMSRTHILSPCIDIKKYQSHKIPDGFHYLPLRCFSPIIITIARLSFSDSYKGIDFLITEVLPLLTPRYPKIKFLVVGDGDDKNRLIQLTHAVRMSPYVIFTGFVSENDKISLLKLSDVFILPSSGEGFGIVFLEALASGTPVVGGNSDGTSDALMNGTLGTQVDVTDAQSMAHAIDNAIINGFNFDSRLYTFDIISFYHNLTNIILS